MDNIEENLCGLDDKIIENSRKNPNKIAIKYKDNMISYKQLVDRAMFIASMIIDKEIEAESVIAACMDVLPVSLDIYLGVFMAGCIILPLCTSDPAKRQLQKLDVANVSLLFVEDKYGELFDEYKGEKIFVNADTVFSQESFGVNSNIFKLRKSNLAYIIFTSGTTGEPKGILNTMDNLVDHFISYSEMCNMSSSDITMGFSPLYFDCGFEEILAPLFVNSTIVIPNHSDKIDPHYLISQLNENQITILSAPPPILNILNKQVSNGQKLQYLKMIVTGGDVLKYKDINYLINNVIVKNGYGLSEATVSTLWHRVTKEDTDIIPIGKPIRNKRVYILDDRQNPVNQGEIGEIYLAGHGVALGYIKDEELTKEKFIKNPFITDKSQKMVKTGDLGRFLDDGSVEFLGRKDRQVNISGIRMELLEIENTLLKYEQIQDCSVIESCEDDSNYLSAYLVIKDNETLNLDRLRALFRKYLPLFMMPRKFYQVSQIPKTEVGKVDLAALRQLNYMPCLYNGNDLNTLSDIEQKILSIWSEVLKIDTCFIPSNVNFFEIGGNSLLAMNVLTKIKKQFHKQIIMSEFITNTTIVDQAKLIESKVGYNYEIKIPKAEPKDYYKITSAQKRIWILTNLENNSAMYNTVSVSCFNGELNVEKFHNVLKQIMYEYPILTVSFFEKDEVIYQRPRNNCDFPFEFIDITKLEKGERDSKIQSYIEKEKNYNFNLEKEILIHSSLFQTAKQQYIFVLNIHHLITDNQSWIIMLSKIHDLYNDNTNKIENTSGLSYFDYVEYENTFLMSEQIEKQLKYWEEKLANSQSMLLDFMPYRKRPNILGIAGASKKISLNKQITNQIKLLAQKENTSCYSFLLSAFKILIYIYTGQKDTIIGTPVVNRNLVETESMVGLFLNLICIRDILNPDGNPIMFMHQIHSTVQEAICNQDYPFEKVIEQLNPERKLNQSPIFQILFDYHGDDTDIFTLNNLKIENIPVESNWAKNELTVTGIEDSGEIILDFEYNSLLYSAEFIDDLIVHYVKLIINILKTPEIQISNIDILTDNDVKYINNYNNSSTVFEESSLVLHEIFEQQVMRTPDKIAYRYKNEMITFDELNKRTNKVARVLKSLGIGPKIIVAICFDKSIELQIILLAIIKTGAAYLPLDPNHPQSHINNIIKVSKPDIILTNNKNSISFCFDGKILDINNYQTQINKECEDNLENQSNMDSLFNVIFTSASTGIPKGVMTTMRAVLNRLHWAWNTFPFVEGDVILHHKSYTLIGSFWEMFGGLLQGIETVIIPREHILSGMLRNDIITYNISLLFASPPILKPLIKDFEENITNNMKLRLVACSAEPISGIFVKQWKKVLKDVKLINLYGSTEDCSDVTFYDTDEREEMTDLVPAGKPISFTKIYILNDNDKVVPPNIIGKICVSGAAVSKGYINNQVLTDKVFKIVTLYNGEAQRLYFTGDIGYIDKNYNLVVVGRYDYQVKIRGYLMELSDIEIVLKDLPFVQNAGVITVGEDNEDKSIIAYISLLDKMAITKKELLKKAKEKLPEYMIPAKIIILDELPMTPNGKINRLALPNPNKFFDIDDEYVEPRTPMERVIKEIWENILGISKISVFDNFFEIGGDSLKAIQMIGHIRHIFSINYPIMELFTKPTISAMSNYVGNMEGEEDLSYEIKANPPREKYPLAYIQEGFWFYNKLEPRNIFYNIAANRIRGKFNYSLFKKAFHEVILRHDALRMVFSEENGIPFIRILDNIEVNIPIVDLTYLQEADKQSEMMRLSRKEINTPFDFKNGPLIRAVYFDYGIDDCVILINMHHIVTDGWSINILLSDISELYNHYLNNEKYQLPELTTMYSDFIIWQKSEMFQKLIDKQKIYWKNKLSGKLPELHLKGSKIRPELVTYKGEVIEFQITKEKTESLKQLGYQYRSTLFMVLLSIYYITLYRYTKDEDIIVGSPIAGRGYPQVEKVIGCYVNTLCIRSKCKGDMNFSDLIEEVRENVIGAFSNSNLSFDELVKLLNPKRDISRSPIFQAMMTMQDKPSNLYQLNGTKITDAGVINDLAPYDLSVIIWVEDDRTIFYIEYYSDVFTEQFIRSFFIDYQKIMDAVLEDSNKKIDNISLLEEKDCEKIIFDWLNIKNALVPDKEVKEQISKYISDDDYFILLLDNEKKPVSQGMMGCVHLVSNNEKENKSIKLPYNLTNSKIIETSIIAYYFEDKILHLKYTYESNKSEDNNYDILREDKEDSVILKIKRVWEKLLEKEILNLSANYFDLGGTSLQVVQMLEVLNQEFSINMTVIDLFKHSSIVDLARYVKQCQNGEDVWAEDNERSNRRSKIDRTELLRNNRRRKKNI